MSPDETLNLNSGSRIYLVNAGGEWFNGKKYCATGTHAWQLIDKTGCIRGRGTSASREEALKEATLLDSSPHT